YARDELNLPLTNRFWQSRCHSAPQVPKPGPFALLPLQRLKWPAAISTCASPDRYSAIGTPVHSFDKHWPPDSSWLLLSRLPSAVYRPHFATPTYKDVLARWAIEDYSDQRPRVV